MYFTEDMTEAIELVDSTLADYKNLLAQLTDTQQQEVKRTIGLKMEELRAQKSMMEDEAKQMD